MKLNIGDNIRSHRRQADMTQEQLADKLGVSYQSVSRWENGSTYPDMELLPAIAKIFGISIDELLGMPDEKREEEAQEVFTKLAKATFESPVDTNKVVDLIRDIRRNYLDSTYFFDFWVSTNNRVYRIPEVLPEVRFIVEDVLDGKLSMFTKNNAIQYMSMIEDDEHIEKFLERYASEFDLTKNTLLYHRYLNRGDLEKAETLRQFFLYRHIDQLIGNSDMWRDHRKAPNLSEAISANNIELSLLHQLCGQIPDEKYPISGNGEVDFWVEPRMWMGFRKASYLSASGDTEGAFIVLEDTVSLLEKAMEITAPVELRCTSPWLDSIIWTAEESWGNPYGSPVMASEEERCMWIHNYEGWCYVLYPSWYRDVLKNYTKHRRGGWEWFEPISNDPRYAGYIERLNKLVITKSKN